LQTEKILRQQGYALVGRHSAVKLCHWLRRSLLDGVPCYKHTFYGIDSHRCLQMSPTTLHCTQKCLYCWRYQGFTITDFDAADADDPNTILDACVNEQYRLLTGYKGDGRVDATRWREAISPRHVACSLTGEPTLYPFLSDFFAACHRRGITTFLVTNGTTPQTLAEMDTLPTQLYVTLAAPNEEVYKKVCCPLVPNAWQSIQETLELLGSLDTRTVIRHTLVKGWNLGHEEEYARLDARADPWFIEPKGYVFVGYSRKRMHLHNMPDHGEVVSFARRLADLTGYAVEGERPDSRVVLLGRSKRRLIA
jgi:tRNA wybutosine-synthesizing protein 1